MHPAIFLARIQNVGHWPWLSMSFWPFWIIILGSSDCPRDDSSQNCDLGGNPYICTKHASWDTYGLFWKWKWLSLNFNFILASLTQNSLKFVKFAYMITFDEFELEPPNLQQICILGVSHCYWNQEWPLRSFGYFEFQEKVFKVALEYWYRLARGCCTSQTCSCYPYGPTKLHICTFTMCKLSPVRYLQPQGNIYLTRLS